MCGICGYLAADHIALPEADTAAMARALRHRGPDGEQGTRIRSSGLHGWIGHRRLKVIDLTSTADQPMASDNGRTVLSFNGEIYNFLELRAELRARGHRFRSSGDTEVVLRAYESWGERFVTRLDGMFAIALWDAERGRLLLARDRTGKKPLFYASDGRSIAFASETRALFACPWVPRKAAINQLPFYLTYGYVPHPHTFYEGVSQVPPASTLSFDRAGLHGPHLYWDPVPHELDVDPADEQNLARIRSLLRQAVRKRMVSDVPLGALLSGGIDSSLVVALMTEYAQEPVHTFTIGFPEDRSFDERRYARLVADTFKTRHTEFTVRLDALGLMERILWHYDQPYADSSAIPTFVVSSLASRYVTVVLNGDGGDEVFAGYDRFAAVKASEYVPDFLAPAASVVSRLLPRGDGYFNLRRRAERFLELQGRPVEERYQSWIAVAGSDDLSEILSPDLHELLRDVNVRESMRGHYRSAAHLPNLDRIVHANFRTYLPDDLAVKMDRMSMASSLEARSPFLDTALIEFVARIPASKRVGLFRTKPLLRRALSPLLPRAIWNRRKHGFGVPLGQWFRGELGAVFDDEVLTADARTAPYLRPDVMRRVLAEHRSGAGEHATLLWTVLTLEHWLRSLDVPSRIEPPRVDGLLDAEPVVQA